MARTLIRDLTVEVDGEKAAREDIRLTFVATQVEGQK